jgi:hypothetical protein
MTFVLELLRVEQVNYKENLLCTSHSLFTLFNKVTLVCGFTIFALLMFETVRYMTPIMSPEIMVDGGQMVNELQHDPPCIVLKSSFLQEKLPINFDVSFPNLPCYSKYIFLNLNYKFIPGLLFTHKMNSAQS